MAKFDSKEYARQMRENCAKDHNGNIICSSELWEQMASIIETIPTADVVEVVRCKDCLYSHYNSSSGRYTCQREYPRRTIQEDDFCSYGKPQKEV